MKKKAIKVAVSWKDKIVQPKDIKNDGIPFKLVPQGQMELIKEDG